MDYDVVKECVQNAYKNFRYNDKKFYGSLNEYYKHGRENPSVAKIIMREQLNQIKSDANRILYDAVSLPSASIFEPLSQYSNEKIYTLSISTAIKSAEAEEIYKKANKSDVEDVESNTNLKNEFLDSWKKKYPRTGDIREHIIETNRLSTKEVRPKASWFEKISIAKTIAEYQKKYPKTFYARYSLITDKQINETNITPRVKNWFKRLSYKMLINGIFSFKK